MQSIQIGPYTIGKGQKPLVIAEAGINHNGDLAIAREMIRLAKRAGADVIKFQTHIAHAEMLRDKDLGSDGGSHVTGSLFEIMRTCELSYEAHMMLKEEAEKNDILFLSTPFSIEAVDLLERVGVPAYKIGSGEVTNVPFIEYVAGKGKPVILSTGTAAWDEVVTAVTVLKDIGVPFALMQCTSNYPTAYQNVNVGVVRRMRKIFNVPIGLSDHCAGNYACFGAVAKGACMVEKHFTVSRALPGVDQSSSIEPHELADLGRGVRAVYEACGNEKELNDEALKVRHGFSESIVTIRAIKKGEVLEAHENIWVKRPGSGIPSYELSSVIGRVAKRKIPADYLLSQEDFE